MDYVHVGYNKSGKPIYEIKDEPLYCAHYDEETEEYCEIEYKSHFRNYDGMTTEDHDFFEQGNEKPYWYN